MRGRRNPQASMLAFVDLEERVPPHHPLRTIKRFADRALTHLSPTFDAMYGAGGRPSIPPERLLKASLLIALYSIRSETAFCEELDYQLLYRWFLDMGLLDFPCVVDDQIVLLCWKFGEEKIEFWHGLEEGFRGRKPIDERIMGKKKEKPN